MKHAIPLRDKRSAISTSSGSRTGQERFAPHSRRFLEGVELSLHLIEAEEVRGRAVKRPAQVIRASVAVCRASAMASR